MNVTREMYCAVNPLRPLGGGPSAMSAHLRPRRIENDSGASAASYRRIRVVPMVRRTARRYGRRAMGANRAALMVRVCIFMKGNAMRLSTLSIAMTAALVLGACGDRQNTSSLPPPTSSAAPASPSSSSPARSSDSAPSSSAPSSAAAPAPGAMDQDNSKGPSSGQSSPSNDKDKSKS